MARRPDPAWAERANEALARAVYAAALALVLLLCLLVPAALVAGLLRLVLWCIGG